MSGLTTDQIARWRYDFAIFVARECEVFASELVLERGPNPDPMLVVAAIGPYREAVVDAQLRGEGWRFLYPINEASKREWVRRTFGERLRHHVAVEWLKLRGR